MMNHSDTMACGPVGCEPRWEQHHRHRDDRGCDDRSNVRRRAITKRLSILPYIRPQNNISATLYACLFDGVAVAPGIDFVPNTDPAIGYIRFGGVDGPLVGFDLRPPSIGDTVLIANIVTGPPPYVNNLPPPVTNALYVIETLPSELMPWFILRPYNFSADPCNGWRVDDMIFSQFSTLGPGGYDIVQIGTAGPPAFPNQVYVSRGYNGSFAKFGNLYGHLDADGELARKWDDCDDSDDCYSSEDDCSDSYDSYSSSSYNSCSSYSSSSCYSSEDDCDDRPCGPEPIRLPRFVPPRSPLPPVRFGSDDCSSYSSDCSDDYRHRRHYNNGAGSNHNNLANTNGNNVRRGGGLMRGPGNTRIASKSRKDDRVRDKRR